ncbi:hypothetical protein LEP1GSC170_1456 [Leptospira interrogans serovar Bataviae str. HAI135]|nr:hypothetical protein LEP1GSC170_1456 [Leptospira interrogans serovar Bataviae str. HAI135]
MYIKPLEDHKGLNVDHAFEKILFLLNRSLRIDSEDRDIFTTPYLIALMSICGVALKNIDPDIIYEFSKIHFGVPSPVLYDGVITSQKLNRCSECGRTPKLHKRSDSPARRYSVRCHFCHFTTMPHESKKEAAKLWNNKQVWVELRL